MKSLCLALLTLGAMTAFAQTPAPAPTQAPLAPLSDDPPAEPGHLDPKLPTLFIAGDSTAARAKPPQQGWAVPFAQYFDLTKVNVSNRALGGRSSRTFITQGWWDKLLADVKPGDWVLIQFGHNDAGAINDDSRARGSLPGIGEETSEIDNLLTKKHETVRTFGSYLRQMIRDVRARGATPLLLSPTVRNNWKDGRVERDGGHRTWAREVAQAEKVAFVDVRRIVADAYQEIGPEKTAAFYPKDHTHLSDEGADFTARHVVAGLAGLHDATLAKWLSPAGQAVPADTIGALNLPEPRDPKLPTLLLIGDSTVRNGHGDGAHGEWGWGEPLAAHFDPAKVNLVNRAVGGLSSRTFLTQGHWRRALTLLKPGDLLLLQFGHNDDGAVNDTTRARGTLKGTGPETEAIDNLITHEHEVVGTYGSYLRRYVREARTAGVIPIICTPVPRKIWKDGHIVRSDTGYAGWAREVARQEGVPVIDLNALVAARYDALGAAAVNALFADEHTHTSRAGAELNADLVAGALSGLATSDPRLAAFHPKTE